MATFVLIHGASHGAWCWYKLIPLLERQGHTVIAPDLPGHGCDKTPLSEVTLDAYVKRVCEAIDEQTEPVVLVGHSMGGGVISQVAEYRADKIKTLVFLAAMTPENGQTMLGMVAEDTESILVQNMEISDDETFMTFPPEIIREMFYADCPDEDIALARLLLVPQALAPGSVPLTTSEAEFGRVPRVYIECLRDRALTPSLQRRMYAAVPCRKVISMDTDHSPFFSAPVALAEHLMTA